MEKDGFISLTHVPENQRSDQQEKQLKAASQRNIEVDHFQLERL